MSKIFRKGNDNSINNQQFLKKLTLVAPIYTETDNPMRRYTDKEIREAVNEELSRSDVRSMIDSRIEDYIKEKEFKKAVKELAADALEVFFREMWTKRSVWKGAVKNS